MTKRIFRSIFSVSAVILVISIGLIMGLLYGHFGDQLEKELKQEAVYLAIAVENDGVESLNRLSKTGERVTLIDEDGTVLYDNKADAGTMENHQDREEVQAAQKSGEGYASRTSATLGEKTVYYALRLENGQKYTVYNRENPGWTDSADPGYDLSHADSVSGGSLPFIQEDRGAFKQTEPR